MYRRTMPGQDTGGHIPARWILEITQIENVEGTIKEQQKKKKLIKT